MENGCLFKKMCVSVQFFIQRYITIYHKLPKQKFYPTRLATEINQPIDQVSSEYDPDRF